MTEVEVLHNQSRDELLRMSQEYLAIFDRLGSFFLKLRKVMPKLSSEDQVAFLGACDSYDVCRKNLSSIIDELKQFLSYDVDEKVAVLEIGAKIVSYAGLFVAELPTLIQKSHIYASD